MNLRNSALYKSVDVSQDKDNLYDSYNKIYKGKDFV